MLGRLRSGSRRPTCSFSPPALTLPLRSPAPTPPLPLQVMKNYDAAMDWLAELYANTMNIM